jgi:hypothetical protein
VPRAVTSFVTTVKGEEHFVHAGEVLPPNHPVVKARLELFEPDVLTNVDQAHLRQRQRQLRRAATRGWPQSEVAVQS